MEYRAGILALCLTASLLAGCAREPSLYPASRSNGPDEFSIVPNKPLVEPDTFAQLPVPTPGGVNLSDPTPKADAVVALGGNPRAGVAADDLVAAASRYGIDPAIRAELAAADLKYRRARNGFFLTRLFARNQYERAYRRYGLDPWNETERLRALGLTVPDAPPEE